MISRLILAVMSCLAVSSSVSSLAAIQDPDFTETSWISVGGGVTGMAWVPDGSGRLFVTFKEGDVRIVKAGSTPTLLPTPFATVSPIFTNGECGLIGIAFDPDFDATGYVYVFATVSSTEQQIIRYTAVGDVGTDKTVVISDLPTRGSDHDGGAIGFGPDGKLYWAIGDLGNGTGVDADLTQLASKVGRADVEGTAPADNPFADGSGPNDDFIWARGFRNPFTFTFQPETGALWVNVTGDRYEQIFVVGAGDHAGWDDYQNDQPAGFIPPVIKYVTNGTETHGIAANGAVRSGGTASYATTATHGLRQGEKVTIAGVLDPSFHGTFHVASVPGASVFTVVQSGLDATSGGGTVTTVYQGGAVTGGTFYDATAFPASHRGNFFYGDFNSGRIMRATIGPGSSVTSVDSWATGAGDAIDVAAGPDGALYYVNHAGAVFRASYDAAQQGLIVSNAHVAMGEGRPAVFTVRLALVPTSDVTVDVARTAGSTNVIVAQGGVLTFTPADWDVPQIIRLWAAEDDDLAGDEASFTVASPGLPSETVQARVRDTSGPYGGGAPGRVPDGHRVPGVPLRVGKNAVDPRALDLSWSPSCSAAATDYSIQEGSLGSWYSHEAVLCSTGGSTSATIRPGSTDRYFIVVARNAEREGSYGSDSADAERPRSRTRCRSERDTSSCP